MDETLREVIEHYVRKGYQLTTLTPGGSATLVRDSEQLRLRLDGRWVLFDETPEAEPQAERARGGALWLPLLLAAAATMGAAGLILIGFALLFDDDGGSPAIVATPSVSPTQTASASPTGAPTVTATASATVAASPTPTATPTATTLPLVTTLVARDQVLAPDSRRIVVEEVAHDAPFYVVVYAGDASALGQPLAASALLAAGTHSDVVVPLPRAPRDGEQLWVALHAEQNGNTSFDGPAIDRPLTEALSGSRGPRGEVAARIVVTVGMPIPPVSGNAGVARDGSRAYPAVPAAALLALVLASIGALRLILSRSAADDQVTS